VTASPKGETGSLRPDGKLWTKQFFKRISGEEDRVDRSQVTAFRPKEGGGTNENEVRKVSKRKTRGSE